ncbi:class I SAM-dependent methyltransferase [Flavobacterium sp. PL12]|uniref:class I SAM-dependent methyltransferase n=1 Tax=Flavobacterium sp. PL12 TaxID=3071718 RepID=UPI00319EB0BE
MKIIKNISAEIKKKLNKLPYIRVLYQQSLNSCFPNGHFYSPIILIEEVKKREVEIWKKRDIDGVLGIDLRTEEQKQLVRKLIKYYQELPFKAEKQANIRYQFENGSYSYTDGVILYSMIRYSQPKRIIEVGSGHSSMVMLDTNELFFKNQIDLTFIEPYPERLYSLMKDSDKEKATVLESDVQLIPLSVFEELESGDILFIDSTHVSKTGSDVNYMLFEILPILKSGVLIHFHDVFYPFEYPKEWVFQGRNWNENYILRAFLMYNENFEIKLFSEYLHTHHKTIFEEMPLCYKNPGGNLWIEKK